MKEILDDIDQTDRLPHFNKARKNGRIAALFIFIPLVIIIGLRTSSFSYQNIIAISELLGLVIPIGSIVAIVASYHGIQSIRKKEAAPNIRILNLVIHLILSTIVLLVIIINFMDWFN